MRSFTWLATADVEDEANDVPIMNQLFANFEIVAFLPRGGHKIVHWVWWLHHDHLRNIFLFN